MKHKKRDILELDIIDTAEGDACTAKTEDGMVVFVRGLSAPGDRIKASISKIKKNFMEARLEEVITPSPDRADPVCSHYGVCGGCKWQHVQYDAQLTYKRKLVKDALEHIGGFEDTVVHETMRSEKFFHYRNKVDFTFSNERFILDEEWRTPPEEREKPSDFAVGFNRRGFYRKIIDIDQCHIATDASSKALQLTREFFLKNRVPAYSTDSHTGELRNLVIRHAGTTNQLMVNLITSTHDAKLMAAYKEHMLEGLGDQLTTLLNSTTSRKNLVAYGDKSYVLHGEGNIREVLDGLTFVISPNSFFQTNSRQAIELYSKTTEYAELKEDDVLFDLYCGTGSITMFAGKNCRTAYGFELEQSSIDDAKKNAVHNKLDHCKFFATDMKHLKEAMTQADEKPDVVITDPPRAGMHKDAVDVLRELNPRTIVYVSCHPASLARDASMLCEGGQYKLVEVQPVDLFPHTFHVESVAKLIRV